MSAHCRIQVRGFFCTVAALALATMGTVISIRAGDEPVDNVYPLGNSLAVLERDLTSKEYAEVLDTMIPTDLAAEWKRVATEDNHETFLARHGGREKVVGDAKLKAAYDRRLAIAAQFLELMRQAYKKRGLVAPFDQDEKLDLLSVASRGSNDSARAVPVRTVMPAPGAERHWPRLRGPDGQGTVVGSSIPFHWSDRENVVWKSPVPGRGNSSPIVWGERLFLTSANDDGSERWMLCYNTRDGKLLWQKPAPAPVSREVLYRKNSYASATPVTDGERVIAFLGSSGLVAWDFQGNPLWHVDLGPFPTGHGPGASPVLYRDRVFLVQDQNQGESVFVAVDKRSGELLWRNKRPGAMCWTTPSILHVDGRDELVHNGSQVVVAYDPESGHELWSVRGTSPESIPGIVVGGGLIYSMSGRNGPILAIRPGGSGDVTTSHIAWQLPRGGPHVPSPTFHKGHLYVVNDMGIATCLDAVTGVVVWQQRLKGKFSMSPLEIDGKLLVTSETGTTYILQTGSTFQVLATNELGEEVLATPAVVDGRLYFRTREHLYCVGSQ